MAAIDLPGVLEANGYTAGDIVAYRFEFADGTVVHRRVRAQQTSQGPPVPAAPAVEQPAPEFRTRVLAVLSESDGPVTRKQLAKALRLKALYGRNGQTLNAMVEAGEVFERDGYFTDDETKFPD